MRKETAKILLQSLLTKRFGLVIPFSRPQLSSFSHTYSGHRSNWPCFQTEQLLANVM